MFINIRKAITVLITLIFLFTSLDIKEVCGEGTTVPFVNIDRMLIEEGSISDVPFSPGGFYLPEYLGYVESTVINDEPGARAIIHIQDAHCNYFAQGKIALILRYLRERYGIRTVNLEGGKGKYDLSAFTDIEDRQIRAAVCDKFLREGIVNGAEYYASLNPEKLDLWGIENEKAYLKNLNAFYVMNSKKTKAFKFLDKLKTELLSVKQSVFNEELRQFDIRSSSFRNGRTGLEAYLGYLLEKADGKNIYAGDNLSLLAKVIRLGQEIDFARAETERDELIENLKTRFSKRETIELIGMIKRLTKGEIPEEDLYGYLLEKAGSFGSDAPANISAYLVYKRMSKEINEEAIFRQLDLLEEKIVEATAEENCQVEAWLLSRNLSFIEKMLSLNIGAWEYELYLKNKERFKAGRYLVFLEKYAPDSGIIKDNKGLYLPLEEAEDFYNRSYARDMYFLRNLRFPGNSGNGAREGVSAAVMITGGFHSRNIEKLLKNTNTSYIRILPKFETPELYECPYYRLISGGESGLISSTRAGISMIALKSFLTELGEDHNEKGLLRIAARILEAGMMGKDITVNTARGDILFSSSGHPGWQKIEIGGYALYYTRRESAETLRAYTEDELIETGKNPFFKNVFSALVRKKENLKRYIPLMNSTDMSGVKLYGNEDINTELRGIRDGGKGREFFSRFKKMSWWIVPVRFKRSFEFKGIYKYAKGRTGLRFILKEPYDGAAAFAVKEFYKIHRETILPEYRDGMVPFFSEPDLPAGFKIFELDLSPFGYITLQDYLKETGRVVDDDLRRRVIKICGEKFRPGHINREFFHSHLHSRNILVKPGYGEEVEDIRIIDWTMLKEYKPLNEIKAFRKGDRNAFRGKDLSSYKRIFKCEAEVLTDADFAGSDLRGAIFVWADLRGASFKDAKLNLAQMIFSDLTGADLTGADLSNVNFEGAKLAQADLRNADLDGANFDLTLLDHTLFDRKHSEFFQSAGHSVTVKEDHCIVTGTYLPRQADNIKNFQAEIKKDMVDNQGKPFYSEGFVYGGKIYDQSDNESVLETLMVRSPGVSMEEDKDKVKYFILRDTEIFGSKPVFLQQALYEKMRMLFNWEQPETFGRFLNEAMKTRYGKDVNKEYLKIRASDAPGFIFMLYDSSPSILGNHLKDGIIGVNRMVFQKIKNKGVVKTLLQTGFTHELAHESGEYDEGFISDKDAVLAADLAGRNKTDLSGVIDPLLNITQEHSIFVRKAIDLYLDKSDVRRIFAREIKAILDDLNADPDTLPFRLTEYFLTKISGKVGNNVSEVLYMIRSIAHIKGVEGTEEMLSILPKVEKALMKSRRAVNPEEMARVIEVWSRILSKPYVELKHIDQISLKISGLTSVVGKSYVHEMGQLEKILSDPRIKEHNYPIILKSLFNAAVNAKGDKGSVYLSIGTLLRSPVVTSKNLEEVLMSVEKISSAAGPYTSGAVEIISVYSQNPRISPENIVSLLNALTPVFEELCDSYGTSVVYTFRNIRNIVGRSGLVPDKLEVVLRDMGLIPGEEITPGTALLLNLLIDPLNIFPQEYVYRQKQFITERVSSPTGDGYTKCLRNAPGLRQMGFSSGGFATNDASMAAKNLLLYLEDLSLNHAAVVLKYGAAKDLEAFSPVELFEKAGFTGEMSFVKAQGRTLIFEDNKGEMLCVKLKKKNESLEDLAHEPEMIEFLREKYSAGKQKGISPEPVRINGSYLFILDLESMAFGDRKKVRKSLNRDKKVGKEVFMDIGAVPAFAYKIGKESEYNKYPGENITEEAFMKACIASVSSLGKLAGEGIVHTSLIDIFHNIGVNGQRRYIWSAELDMSLGRQGAGRLTAWRHACKWPNISKNGEIRDFAELRGVDDVAADIRKYLGVNGSFINSEMGTVVRNSLLMHFLGEYTLAITLLYGEWMLGTGKLPGIDEEAEILKIAGFMREIYFAAAEAFLGYDDSAFREEMDMVIDWKRMAKQIVFFMGEEYIKYVDPATRENYDKEIWREIYGNTSDVTFGHLRDSTFTPGIGFVGDEAEKRFAKEARALGPVGGALPLQEIITANYYIFSTAVANKKLKQQKAINRISGDAANTLKLFKRAAGLSEDSGVYSDMSLFLLNLENSGRIKDSTFMHELNALIRAAGEADTDIVLFLCGLFSDISLGLSDEGVFYCGKILTECLKTYKGEKKYIRDLAGRSGMKVREIKELTGYNGGEAIRTLYFLMKEPEVTAENSDRIFDIIIDIAKNVNTRFHMFIGASIPVIKSMPLPYEESLMLLRDISASSGKYKAVRAVKALKDILELGRIRKTTFRENLEQLINISENSGSGSAEAYRLLYSILVRSAGYPTSVTEELFYLSEISYHSGTASEYVYSEINDLAGMNNITGENFKEVLRVFLSIVRCSKDSRVEAVKLAGEILESEHVTGKNFEKVLSITEKIARVSGVNAPEAYILARSILACRDVSEKNCAKVLSSVERAVSDVVEASGIYSGYFMLMLANIISNDPNIYFFSGAVDLLKRKEKVMEVFIDGINDHTDKLPLPLRKIIFHTIFRNMILEVNTEEDMTAIINENLERVKQSRIKEIQEEAPGAAYIEMRDGGRAPNNAADIAARMIKETPGIITEISDIPGRPIDIIPAGKYNIRQLSGLSEGEIKGDLKFVKAIGRTIVFTDASGDRINIKIRKKAEEYEDFCHEPFLMDWASKNIMKEGSESFPRPVKIGGNYSFTLDLNSLDKETKDTIKRSLKEASGQNRGFSIDERSIAFAYKVPSGSGYDSYIQENERIEDVKDALDRAAAGLGSLASKGLFHTSLIDIFHNLDSGGRRYMWTTQLNGSSAGRITSWKLGCKWPNVGRKGEIRDWADIKTLKDIKLDPLKYLGEDGDFITRAYGKKSDQALIMHFLGEYALSLVLLYGDWLTEKGLMPDTYDKKGISELGKDIRRIYSNIIFSYLGVNDIELQKELDDRYGAFVEWDLFAVQMAFFMTNEHASEIIRSQKTGSGTDNLWKDIFGDRTKVFFGEIRPNTFDAETGFKGDINEGQKAQVAAALGPVNGAFVITELIKANYYLFSAAVSEKSEREKDIAGKIPEDKTAGDMIRHTETAEKLLAQIRRGTKDIIVMPCSSIFKAQQFAIGKDLKGEMFNDDVSLYYYAYDSGRAQALRNEIEKSLEELLSCLTGGDISARQLIYSDQKDKYFIESMIGEIAEQKAVEAGIAKDILTERITIIPIGNIPGNGILDDINFIIAARGLLNFQRYESGEYPGGEISLMEKFILFEHLDAVFEGLDALGKSPTEIIAKILKSQVINIKRMDFGDIREYKIRQKTFLKSL